ncbi:hypothetical protein BDZ89DRAFT_1102636 [Hymenopellis radicata]|nr:hypothetical protein BDZ89DRAFT_1102636 [Hymenopellis radicata]
MAARTFTIFQDTPTDPAPSATTATTNTLTTMTATTSNVINTITTLVVEADKENLHPLTGERSGPSTSATGKKRKNSISSVKALAPIEVKKMKEDPEPEPKKHLGKKEAKTSGTARKRSSRAPSPMPKVEEEGEAEKVLTQAEIDSKCYDLTVKPLADVSQAFSQCTPLTWLEEEPEETEEAKLQFVKEVSQEPELHDLFTPASVGLESSRSHSQEPTTFSTPERKQLYHSFTFASPSPIRMPKVTRSASVPRLDIPSPATA